MPSLRLTWKALRTLGLEQMTQLGIYRLGLLSGHYRRTMPSPVPEGEASLALPLPEYHFPLIQDRAWALEACQNLRQQIANPRPLFHWTAYETRRAAWGVEDVKSLWEPARFDWAVLLGWDYRQENNEEDARLFWQTVEEFCQTYPPNLGPHWASGQEVALRLIALTCAAGLFDLSPHTTDERRANLNEIIAQHAARIPPTLCYARAQNNNHLVSEAVGLYTAGTLLNTHPNAQTWQQLGWKWFNRAVQKQVADDGTYVQHSTNYHRLFLTLAVWMQHMARLAGQPLPESTCLKLAAATRWLESCIDLSSGHAPNLGHNDGARILPLAGGDFNDFRPILQAASWAFLNQHALPPGAWDSQAAWLLGAPLSSANTLPPPEPMRAYLRCEQFTSRPAHADQLHLDLWWHGQNITLDAGTYQYNAAPPWENGLARTHIHNTIEIDHQDQMTRAGRFLWLDWAQGKKLPAPINTQIAEHDGYRRLGVLHRRSVEQLPDASGWRVLDELLPYGKKSQSAHHFRLHWLLPDEEWLLERQTLRLKTILQLSIHEISGQPLEMQLIRAGKVLYGSPKEAPTQGWYSPTYGVKVPALSLCACCSGFAPLRLITYIQTQPEKSGPKSG